MVTSDKVTHTVFIFNYVTIPRMIEDSLTYIQLFQGEQIIALMFQGWNPVMLPVHYR